MSTAQNIRKGREASVYDVAQLIVQGLAGQRSPYADAERWSGREWEAVRLAAEHLQPLYEHGLLPDELIGRMGRSIL